MIRDEVVEMFSDFTRDESHSILISSHIVSDLEKLCDYIAFLHKGKLLLCEEKDQLLAEYGLIHCTADELQALPSDAVKYKKENTYGVEAMVLRNAVPLGISISPISIEELFVFMLSVSTLTSSISLPFMFKLGVEKGRTAYYVMIGFVCGASVLASSLLKGQFAAEIKPNLVLAILAVVGIGIYIFSWYMSVVFYKKREIQ